MLKNDLKIAFRAFSKNKLFTFINIVGLAIGLSSSYLIFTYVDFEKSYDDFHSDVDLIYRVALNIQKTNGQTERTAQNYPALGPALKNDFSQITDYTRLYNAISGANSCTISSIEDGNEVIHNQNKIYFADASFLSLFAYLMYSGDKATALEEPNSLVLSATQARNYFGNEEATGKLLRVNIDGDIQQYLVKGVFYDLPENSHFDFDFLLSYSTLEGSWYEEAWDWNEFYTYVKVAPKTSIKDIENSIPQFIQTHLSEKHKKYGMSETFDFQPVKDIHLQSNLSFEMEKNGDLNMVNLLQILGISILFFAWTNYINLSLAVTVKRLKEVGIRKMLGANNYKILRQLIVEFSILAFIAILISLSLVQTFNANLAKYFNTDLPVLSQSIGWLNILILIVGSFLAGILPAILLTSYKPISALSGDNANIKGGFTIRKVLLVSQFAISVVMIAGAFSVYKQINFLKEQELGMEIENILVLHAPNYSYEDTSYHQTYQNFKNEVLRHSSILDVTSSSSIPGVENNWSLSGVIRKPSVDRRDAGTYYFVESDINYMDFFGFDLAAGRDFSESSNHTYPTIILNETARKLLGFKTPEQAIGSPIIMDQNGEEKEYSTVVGVLKDFRQEYGKRPIHPVIFWTHQGINQYYCLKLSNTASEQSVTLIKAVWSKLYPENEFNYFYLEDFYGNQFQAEATFQKSFSLATYQALIIACLGLLGLSILSGASKLKELGIRKVFGASSANIVHLISKDLLKLILVSNIVGLPISYWLISQWLSSYATRIELGWWFYVAPTIMLIFVTFLVMSYQLFVSIRVNPVKVLRNE